MKTNSLEAPGWLRTILSFALVFALGLSLGVVTTKAVLFNWWGGPGDHVATEWRNKLDSVADAHGNLRSDDQTTARILSTINAATFGVARLYDQASPEIGQRFAQEVAQRIEANPHLQKNSPDPFQSAALRRCILSHADAPSQVVECSLKVLATADPDTQARFGMAD